MCDARNNGHLGLLFHDNDLGVCRGINSAAQALGVSLNNPKPLFDALLPLASGETSISGDITGKKLNIIPAL